MGLPSPVQLQDLSSRISQVDKLIHGKWGDFKAVSRHIAMALGSRLIQIQNATRVARATAERKLRASLS